VIIASCPRPVRRPRPPSKKEDIRLHYAYSPVRVRETRAGTKFRVGRLTEVTPTDTKDVSHLIDRTYDYASPRELRWHLAERFGTSPQGLMLSRN
jgi:hypothetical protein